MSLDLFAAASRSEDPEVRGRLIAAGQILDLRERVAGCRACDLRTTCARPAVPDAAVGVALFVLGEAPGAEEDGAGAPFVGRSGRLLRDLLAKHCPVPFAVANTVQCRPPANDYGAAVRSDAPGRCAPFVEQTLSLSGAPFALAVGATALNWFRVRAAGFVGRAQETVGAARHSPFWSPLGVLVFTTWHPAYALRSPGAVAEIAHDLARMRRVIDGSVAAPPAPPAIATGLVEEFTRPLNDRERAALSEQLRRAGWAMLHSRILGHQIVVVDEGKAPRVPPEFGEFPRWTVREITRIGQMARSGPWSLHHLRAVSTIRDVFPTSEVVR